VLWHRDKFIEKLKKNKAPPPIYLMLKVEIEEQRKLNPWDQYITQHKKKIKTKIIKHNSQNNLILKDKIEKKIR
jgi:hypothetical protein